MEHIDVTNIREFQEHRAVKKVPLLSTGGLMGSTLFIDIDTIMLPVRTKKDEEMHYVIDGAGEFVLNGESLMVATGALILVPPNSKYHYTTSGDSRISVLVVKHLSPCAGSEDAGGAREAGDAGGGISVNKNEDGAEGDE